MTNNRSLGTSRVSRAQALARRLETEIIADSLPVGERIGTKKEVRERFGVAVATVNEAVRLMEMRGVVAARPGPGGGLFVARPGARARLSQVVADLDPSVATLGDCVTVRNALEYPVCADVAEHPHPETLAALELILDEMQQAVSAGDTLAYLRTNWAFHRGVAEMCQNSVLKGTYLIMINLLDEELDDFEFGALDGTETEIHRDLLAAISAGGGPELVVAIERHAAHSPLPS